MSGLKNGAGMSCPATSTGHVMVSLERPTARLRGGKFSQITIVAVKSSFSDHGKGMVYDRNLLAAISKVLTSCMAENCRMKEFGEISV